MITDLSKVNSPEELAAGAGTVIPAESQEIVSGNHSETLQEKRTPEQIGAEIRMYVNTGRWITTLCGIEIGRRLVEAKELLPHGEWLPWLKRETEFSERSAQDYMRVFKDYAASQLGMFGPETNTQTFADLPISKALALLSVPESEREAFAKEVDAEHISVRDLKQAIKERDEAMKAAKDAEGRLAAERIESEKKDQAIESFIQDRKDLDRQRTEAEARLKEAERQIAELEKRPVEVAVETVRDEEAIVAAAKEAREKAEAEAVKAANKVSREHDKTLKELNEKIAGLEKQLNKAEDERAEAVRKAESADQTAAKKLKEATAAAEKIRAELEEARRALKASDSDVTAFGIRFNSLQTEYSYLITEYRKIRSKNRETGDKLHEAVRQVLEYFQQELEKEEGAAGA